ncbi:MAG: PEP-CTERM sorting domain-containing protein [Phycisphaerales bacterium]|jgi:hypothetical protein|nr:PEP-CTERM sorting domain-containing protein [Phycisphaerales bacterium]
MRTRNILTLVLAIAMTLAPIGSLTPAAQAAEMKWITGADGNWTDAGSWQDKSDAADFHTPISTDSPRPRAGGVTITIDSDIPATGTFWQDAGSDTTFISQTGGDAQFYRLYLTKDKTNTGVNYTITGDSTLTVTDGVNMAWNNSGSIDSRIVQNGADTTFSTGYLNMCIKSSGQGAYYDLVDGSFTANNINLGSGGASSNAVFTQSGGTATVNTQINIGKYAGTTGSSIYNLDGGSLTIKKDLAGNPFAFTANNDSYFDFDGGTLNLKGDWDVLDLINYADSDFRAFGGNSLVDFGLLQFSSVDIETEAYTAIQAVADPIQTWNGVEANWNTANWTPSVGVDELPVADQAMVVDSGTVTLDAAASDFSAASLQIALDSPDGTVEIASPRMLSLKAASIGDGGVLNVAGTLDTVIGVEIASGAEMTVTGSLDAPILKIAGTLNLTGGTETLGVINLTDGALTTDHALAATSLTATGGSLNLNGNDLTVDDLSLNNSLDMGAGVLTANNSITLNNATLTIANDVTTGTLNIVNSEIVDAAVGGPFTVAATDQYSFENITYGRDVVDGGPGAAKLEVGVTTASDHHLVKLTGANNTYSGETVIRWKSTLEVSPDAANLGSGLLRFWGGSQDNETVLQTSGAFIRTIDTDIKWQQHGGFAAVGGDLTVTLRPQDDIVTPNAQLTWRDNSNGFSYHNLQFGSPTADHAVTLTNPITLNSTNSATVTTFDNPNSSDDIGILSGDITTDGPARPFLKRGVGTLWLQGTNDFGAGGKLEITGGRGSILRAVDGQGLPANANLYFNQGAFESSGDFSRNIGKNAGEVSWDANNGGFSAGGGPAGPDGELHVYLNDAAKTGTVTIHRNSQHDGFDKHKLYLGSATADNVVTLHNDLNGDLENWVILLADNPAVTTDRAVIAGSLTNFDKLEIQGWPNPTPAELTINGSVSVGDNNQNLEVENGAVVTIKGTVNTRGNSGTTTGDLIVQNNGKLTTDSTVNVSLLTVSTNGSLTANDAVTVGGGVIVQGSSVVDINSTMDVTIDINTKTDSILTLNDDVTANRIFAWTGSTIMINQTVTARTEGFFVKDTASTISGPGTLSLSSGRHVNVSGTLAPGDGVGAMNITGGGKLLMQDNSNYEWEVGASDTDTINVTGGAIELKKFILEIVDAGGFGIEADDEFTVFTYSYGVDGLGDPLATNTTVLSNLSNVIFDTSALDTTKWNAVDGFDGLTLTDDAAGRIYLTGLVRMVDEIDVTVPASDTLVQPLQDGQVFGTVDVGADATLTVDSTMTDVQMTNMTLGGGTRVVSTEANGTVDNPVTLTVSGGTLAGGNAVANIGDFDNDASYTNLTVAPDTTDAANPVDATINWLFAGDTDTYIDINGNLTIADGTDINIGLADGSATPDGVDVRLFLTYEDLNIDLSMVDLILPTGWSSDGLAFLAEEDDDGGPDIYGGDGTYLILQNLSADVVVAPVDGDANGSQTVDEADLTILLAQFGSAYDLSLTADFNDDGYVDMADFVILRANWGAGTPPPAASELPSTAPEPATIFLMMAAGLPALLKRRRRE